MATQWLGLIGAVVGALIAGLVQLAVARSHRKTERWKIQRQERRDVYLEALWEVRKFPRFFRSSAIEEEDAREQGKDFELDSAALDEMLGGIDRAEFELRLLGRQDIAAKVAAYRKRFVEWVMSLDPEAALPRSKFEHVADELDDLEEEILKMMRSDLA